MALDNAAAMEQVTNAAVTTHASGDSDTAETPICYFLDTLPQELRDMIYGYLGADYTAVKPTPVCASTIRLKDGPRLAIMLVNKQVSAEYWKRCREMTEIVMIDACDGDHIGCAQLPDTMIKAKTAHALLLVGCDQCFDSQHTSNNCQFKPLFQAQVAWLHRITAEMPHIANINVKIHFPWPFYFEGEGACHFTQWPQSPYSFDLAKALEPFTEVARMIRLTAVGHTGGQMEGRGIIAADALEANLSHRYVCWTKEGGWDDLDGEPTESWSTARRDYADLEGFEYRSVLTDSENEDEDHSEDDEEEEEEEENDRE